MLWKNFDGPDWDRGVFRLFELGMLRGAGLVRGVESRFIERV